MNSKNLLWRDVLVLFGLTGWALALPGYGSEFALSMALTCLMYVAPRAICLWPPRLFLVWAPTPRP